MYGLHPEEETNILLLYLLKNCNLFVALLLIPNSLIVILEYHCHFEMD